MEGKVYFYQLHAPGDPRDGWLYIGETLDEPHRKANFRCGSNIYGGRKLQEARKLFGTDTSTTWTYGVLKVVNDASYSPKELKKVLKQQEAEQIKRYGSDVNGFNVKRVEKVTVTYEDGTVEEFNSVLDAAAATGLFPASVYYSAQKGSSTREKGLKFRIW